MRDRQENTPPSSINGDDVIGMDGENDEELIYLGELDDLQFDDDEMVDDQEEEYDTGMERPEDQSQLAFNKHTGSVFCCDLHPNGKIAVTGGEDDKAYVWSVETGQVIMDCVNHKDSVIFVGFSFDGVYLATIDMCGLIKVWKCNLENQEPWSVAFEYEADDLSWGLWHFGARVLICGAVAGDIYIFKIPSGDIKVLQGHNIRTDCAKIFPDGVRLAAGYEDGAVKIWDLKTNAVLHQVPNGMHDTRVTAIDIHPENNLMASISTDGKVVLTTSVNGKVVAQLGAENDLEAVAFCPDAQLDYFALGTLNGSITIWDTARQMIRHSCAKSEEDVSAGVTKMIWIKDQLLTGCLDGSLRVYDGRSGERSKMLTGHWSEILDLVYNAKENIVLCTSDDGTARIFKYPIQSDND
ncbi:angio-associated migratory cell protein [Pieris napi]|uniref:angio-associated migratory cell protein n=1 Tax=Pieris napi TaxID=78633 RepID=UPI001FB8D2AD|nr:angio-associated migratory cell protein [Pieris napi]